MISLMSTKIESPSGQKDDVVGEVPGVSSTTDGRNDSFGGLELFSTRSSEKLDSVSLANDSEARVSDTSDETSVSELKNEETSFGVEMMDALENKPSSSHSKMPRNVKDTGLQNGDKEVRNVDHDYDSILSSFDEFAAQGKSDVVGYGYEIGDMVWGKVKSHPWWPGHIYNEQYASPSVQRSKREGHVLVAFFGDSSYGWFLPAELIPFEQNFTEKSRQTNLRSFLHAVEEAVDELSRRRSLGLACRCRNEFNFWPSSFEDYFVVDLGDAEPWLYSSSQINKAQNSFQSRELLSFVQRLALNPSRHQHWSIELIKNKATFLACRKSLFEEFDETYAQAFGTAPARPPRPDAPAALDPSKAPLSGRLVIAEALGKGENSLKLAKTKDQVEKDKYLFKRRDEPSPKKPKKASSIQAGTSGQPLFVDGSGFSGRVLYSGSGDTALQNHEPNSTDGQNRPPSQLASTVSEIKTVQTSWKLVETGMKKAKAKKRPVDKLSSGHAALVENKKMKGKKETKSDASGNFAQLPNVVKNIGVPGLLSLHAPLSDANQLDDSQDSVVGSASSLVESQQAVDFGTSKLPMLLRELRFLALNPFHGFHRSCFANARPVFLNFRSLVYQKSLVSAPTESEAGEVGMGASLPPTATSANLIVDLDENNGTLSNKPIKHSDDSTKSGIKRTPLDHTKIVKKKRKIVDSGDMKKNFSGLEETRKKKFSDPDGIRKKKPMDDGVLMKKKTSESEDVKKMKNIDDLKSLAVVKRPFQRADVNQVVTKNASPTLSKEARPHSNKKTEQPAKIPNPTMLVMKFPSGAGLPSGAQLRARFARFGPMDHAATRVFWKSYTCRVVYHFKTDAEEALKFINGSDNLFGSANVRCYLRDLLAEAAESEAAKIQKDEAPPVSTPQPRDSAGVQRMTASQLLQQSVQLKSCLKKPSNEEGGNGGGRGTRVKFVLDCEESVQNDQIFSGIKNMTNIACYPEFASSSAPYSLDNNSKNLAKSIPHSNNLLPSSSFHLIPSSTTPSSNQPPARFYPLSCTQHIMPMSSQLISSDISQEMLDLLNKCSDVVKNLSVVLGFLPYQPL